MGDENNQIDDDDATYQESPPSMAMGYLDTKMEIAKVRGRTSRGAYVVTLQAIVSGTGMLGHIKDPITGEWKYDYEKEPMKGLIDELKLIKVPKVVVKVEPKYTRIIIAGVGEWQITKNTEEMMLKMIEDERYDVALLAATALLAKVELLLYREDILDPLGNMASQAEIRWLDEGLAYDVNTVMLEGEDGKP